MKGFCYILLLFGVLFQNPEVVCGITIQAWKRVVDNAKNVKLHTDFAVDWQLLQQVQSITLNSQNEATFKHGTIGNFDTFLEVYMKHSPCNTCPKPHLEETIEFCNSKFNPIQLLIDQ